MAELAPLPPAIVAAVARIAAALPEPTPGSHIAMAFERDRTAFLATVLAAWAKGHAVALPRNARRAHVVPVLAREEVVLLAHDTGAGLGLDVPKLLARSDAPSADVRIPLVGAITCHDETVRAWSRDQVASIAGDAAFRMKPARGTKVWNGFSAGAPSALVPGLLVPLTTGCELVDDAADADTIVAPTALLRRIARDAGSSLRQVVAADERPDGRTIDAFLSRGVQVLSFATLGHERADLRGMHTEDRVLWLDGVDDAAAVSVGSDETCCIAATARTADDVRRSIGLEPKIALRCVPLVPRDADGHIDRATVLRYFGRLPDGQVATWTLEFEQLPRDGTTGRFRTTLPSTFFAFDGHFATYAVLSGAMQLHELVMPCARRAFGGDVEPAAFHDLKFLARIAPGDEVVVTIAPAADGAAFEFTISCRGTKCSAGRVALRRAATENAP